MIQLDKALQAWGTTDFPSVLKQEITQLGAGQLPLQKGLSIGSYVSSAPITVLINGMAEMETDIRVTAGIFFNGIIVGCGCSGGSGSPRESNEYCEIQLHIDKATAATTFAFVAE